MVFILTSDDIQMLFKIYRFTESYQNINDTMLPDHFINKINLISMISTAKVVIYGAAYCSFCVKAKNLLLKNKVPVNWIDVEEEQNRLKLLELKKIHNYSTIPMIFVNGQFVGGFSDLVKKINEKQFTYDDLK